MTESKAQTAKNEFLVTKMDSHVIYNEHGKQAEDILQFCW